MSLPGLLPSLSSTASSAGRGGGLTRYANRVHLVRLAMDRLNAGTRLPPNAIHHIQQALRSLPAADIRPGDSISTDLPLLASTISPGGAGLAQATRQIDALDAALHGLRLHAGNPQQWQALDAVLRDPRFHQSQSFWDIVGGWLFARIVDAFRLIGDLWPSTGAATGVAQLITLLLAVLFLAAVVALAYVTGRRLLRLSVEGDAAARSGGDPRTPWDAAAAAGAAEDEGDYRLALRYLLLQTILLLDERGLVDARPGWTNRDYLLGLGRGSGLPAASAAAMTDLVSAFDRSWYGHQPIGAAEYTRCHELARTVQHSLRDGAA